MLTLAFLILGGFLLVVQTSFFSSFPSWIEKPDLLFLLLIFVAIRLRFHQGLILALLFGLFMEIFSGSYLGIYPLVYCLILLLIHGFSRTIFLDAHTHQPVVVAVSYLFQLSGIYVANFILAADCLPDWQWREILLQVLILAIITLPFFLLFEGYNRMTLYLLKRTASRP